MRVLPSRSSRRTLKIRNKQAIYFNDDELKILFDALDCHIFADGQGTNLTENGEIDAANDALGKLKDEQVKRDK